MLHLVFHWPEPSLWQRFGQNHSVVFMGASLYQLLKAKEMPEELPTKITLYVLYDDLVTYGFDTNNLPDTVRILDYPGLVQLTVDQHPICSWT